MGTFSKAIPSNGGFIAVDKRLITYMRMASSQRVFTASATPPNAAAALEGIRILKKEGAERVAKLKDNINHFIDDMVAVGFDLIKAPEFRTAVIPISVKDETKCMRFSKMSQERGVFIHPIRFPAVPPGQALLRACIMACHTHGDIDEAVKIFTEVGRELDIISK